MVMISPAQQHELDQLIRRFHLRFIVLYGSRAKGTERPDSDLDIAFTAILPLVGKDLSNLETALYEIFPAYEIDIRQLEGTAPFFRYEVLFHGVLLAGDPREFARLKLYVIRSFQDDIAVRALRDRLLVRRQCHLESLTHGG